MGAALAALMLATPALAQDLKLPRQKIELVAPPFVHPHEQATKRRPRSSSSGWRSSRRKWSSTSRARNSRPMTFNGSMPGPMMVVHQGDYVELTLVNRHQHDAAQHRLPFGDRSARRRRADPDQSGRAGRAALEGRSHRRVRLSLRAGRLDDPVARRLGMHGTVMVLPREGLKDGAGKACATTASTTSASMTSTCRATRTASTRATNSRRSLCGHHGADAQADPDPCRVQRQGRGADSARTP